MIFDHPFLLPLAPILAALVGTLAWLARKRRIAGARTWAPATGEVALRSGRWAPWLLALAALATGVALAGPRGGRATVTTQTRALSLVFAVDISRSMLAEDVAPSRLQRAVRESRRLVQDLAGDRMGLLAFAGRSYILTPLTLDGGAISLFLDGLSPDLASEGGTRLGSVLSQGGQLLGVGTETGDRVLIVFTDGETHDSLSQTLEAAKALSTAGVRLILVSEGKSAPTRIPVRDSAGALIEYQQDESGKVIETSRRDDVLQAVADAAEGTVVPSDLPDQAGAVRDLVSAFKRSPSSETTTADLIPRAWIPMLVALALLGWQTVRRRTAALVAIASLMLLRPASAQQPSGPERDMAAGHPEAAARGFLEDAKSGVAADTAYYNAGTAALQAGRFDVARRALTEASRSLDPGLRYRALYNLGVVALRQASTDSSRRDALLDEAAGNLQDALLLEPRSTRAKWNLELARRHRPPPSGGGGGSSSPPPPKGGGADAENQPAPGQGQSNLSRSQAEQVLNSVEREERDTRARHTARAKLNAVVVQDW